MNREKRIEHNIETLKIYISEHVIAIGTVSWQTSSLAIKMLEEDIKELENELELIRSERLEK